MPGAGVFIRYSLYFFKSLLVMYRATTILYFYQSKF